MSESPDPKSYRELDLVALQGLAHPLRARILDELAMYGPLTASRIGERLGASSGSTSYHLRQLERHGFVREVVGHGTARERWWERVPGGISTDPRRFPPGSPERLASELVSKEWMRTRESALHEFHAHAEAMLPREWADAAMENTANLALSLDELHDLTAELEEVVARFFAAHKASPSPGAQPVQIQLAVFPLVRREGGIGGGAGAGDGVERGADGVADDVAHGAGDDHS
ncbi:MAG: helix-turn-helix transcriptional regulator [Actinomycetales bacterium]|nr:helix-turn-helix transcriptional regulator [Actinomycetales bacterium]